MREYTWHFDEDAELWNNDTHDTVEACIEDARRDFRREEEGYTEVFVGECVPFMPSVDGEYVLDYIQDRAYEHAGEIGGDWNAYDHRKHDQLNELDEALTKVVCAWMNKYGYYPEFYAVENIRKYPLDSPELINKE